MKINILSRKLIKPSTPTPPNLKNYKLSYIDELSPLIIVPVILFYESTGDDTKKAYLEESLAKILPKFYPFAGRYIEEDQLVDCSDQGVDFVEAQVAADHDLRLPEFIKEIKTEKLSALLPRDHVNDSVLSIQITSFKCGGVVIGVSFLHKVVDADSVGTFISAWANANNLHNKKKQKHDREITIIPNFDSPSLFPCKNFRNGFGVEASKTRNPNIVAKIFVFNKDAITRLKSKVTGRRRAATRVGVVCALIAKVLITLDLSKNGSSRDCLITQAVNIRERTIPPLPKHSCGNLAAFSVAHYKGSDNVGFEDLVELLGESVGKTIENSAEILSGDEGGHEVFIDTVMKVFDATAGGKMNILLFSDWTKFGFYDNADFGWGKPVWVSIDVMAAENLAVLMESKDGDGVEAWVHLNRQDMAYFEQDEEIRSFVA